MTSSLLLTGEILAGRISPVGRIGLMGLIGLISLIGLRRISAQLNACAPFSNIVSLFIKTSCRGHYSRGLHPERGWKNPLASGFKKRKFRAENRCVRLFLRPSQLKPTRVSPDCRSCFSRCPQATDTYEFTRDTAVIPRFFCQQRAQDRAFRSGHSG